MKQKEGHIDPIVKKTLLDINLLVMLLVCHFLQMDSFWPQETMMEKFGFGIGKQLKILEHLMPIKGFVWESSGIL